MSYSRITYERIHIINDNMRTRAFTQSVQKYIWDILNRVRIEFLSDFNMEMDVDNKIITAEYINIKANGYKFIFKSETLSQEEIQHCLNHLDDYEVINITLDYSGSFYFFYSYGVERFSALLNEWLHDKVTYKCHEVRDSEEDMYAFENREGKLLNGVIKPGSIKTVEGVEDWELENFSFWFEFDKSITKAEYEKLKRWTDKLYEKFGLYSKYVGLREKKSGKIRISDLDIQNHGYPEVQISKSKKYYELNEIKNLYSILRKITNLLKKRVDVILPEIGFIPKGSKIRFLKIMITVDEFEHLNLNIYNIDSYEVSEYVSRTNDFLEDMESFGEIYLPMEGANIDENDLP